MKANREPLTFDQLQYLGARREKGKSLGQLATIAKVKFGAQVAPSALSWQMLRIGADLPPERRQRSSIGTTMVVRRGNHLVRRYTPEEDRLILALAEQGLGPGLIGKRLNPPRRSNSIAGRLMTLARHQARAEEEAGGEIGTESRRVGL